MGRKKGHRQQSTEALKLACYKPAGSSVLQEGGAATSFCIWDALEGSVSETTESQVQNVTRASACSATGSTRKQCATKALSWERSTKQLDACTEGSLLNLQDKHIHNPEAGPMMHLVQNLHFLRIKQSSPCSLYLKAGFYFCSL